MIEEVQHSIRHDKGVCLSVKIAVNAICLSKSDSFEDSNKSRSGHLKTDIELRCVTLRILG
jgi:hypothetical protein